MSTIPAKPVSKKRRKELAEMKSECRWVKMKVADEKTCFARFN